MQVKNLQTQKGFTLVEIAIVLVIIGLLLGGVLKGQELITNSKIKSVTQDFDGISAAYYAYQDRTGLISGDGTGANKDGIITTEADFWTDLRTEGFLKGSASDSTGAVHALDGSFSAQGGGSSQLFTKNHICADNIENGVARGMDIKFDDGEPDTGVMRVIEGGTYGGTPATAWNANTETASMICKEL